MVLGEVVSKVICAFSPVNSELTLVDAVSDPVEPHVDCLGSSLFYCAIGDASGAGVVCLDWRSWLGMSHVDEGGSDGGCIFSVHEECSKFYFCGGGEDGFHD